MKDRIAKHRIMKDRIMKHLIMKDHIIKYLHDFGVKRLEISTCLLIRKLG